MTEGLKFRVEAADDDVVVTLDGTAYMVRYCRADNQAGLKLFHTRGDDTLQSTTSTFLLVPGNSPTLRQKNWGGLHRLRPRIRYKPIGDPAWIAPTDN